MFYGTAPGDYAATIAVGADLDFPHPGPTSATTITRVNAGSFNLAAIGTYDVSWQVSIDEPGQFEVVLGAVIQANTVAGRATGTNQITNRVFVTTTGVNTQLHIRNPAGNSTALTVTPNAGGASAASATLTIVQLTP
jgi:hypothetical protein